FVSICRWINGFLRAIICHEFMGVSIPLSNILFLYRSVKNRKWKLFVNLKYEIRRFDQAAKKSRVS
ncbi:MAG: hypothetical protein ACKPEQ_01110, partial [Dolichospermum sp.]